MAAIEFTPELSTTPDAIGALPIAPGTPVRLRADVSFWGSHQGEVVTALRYRLVRDDLTGSRWLLRIHWPGNQTPAQAWAGLFEAVLASQPVEPPPPPPVAAPDPAVETDLDATRRETSADRMRRMLAARGKVGA